MNRMASMGRDRRGISVIGGWVLLAALVGCNKPAAERGMAPDKGELAASGPAETPGTHPSPSGGSGPYPAAPEYPPAPAPSDSEWSEQPGYPPAPTYPPSPGYPPAPAYPPAPEYPPAPAYPPAPEYAPAPGYAASSEYGSGGDYAAGSKPRMGSPRGAVPMRAGGADAVLNQASPSDQWYPPAPAPMSAEAAAPSGAVARSEVFPAPTPPVESASNLHSPLGDLPSGSRQSPDADFATVQVFYATDRAPDPIPLGAYAVSGAREPMLMMIGVAGCLGCLAFVCWYRGRTVAGAITSLGGIAAVAAAAALLNTGSASIEKHGVTYTADRGVLARGIAEVTIPHSHRPGIVERPSLMRFEFQEDQSKHVVMTSATELTEDDFYRRMQASVDDAPERDLLVFIHGYNVDFESAVRRTAQIAIDLPFQGVPVCYSWPSQGELLGYTIDENNVAWTVSHLKTFLYELAEQSGASSINVVAHSMGNRALSGALSEISLERRGVETPMLDRVVLAAPDVDADHFRRDLGPRILETARSVTLYASSDDNALVVSKQVHGYPRAGESGDALVVVPGMETIDVSGIDLSLLGHSYYGDNESILQDLFQLVQEGLPAAERSLLRARQMSGLVYWQLVSGPLASQPRPPVR